VVRVNGKEVALFNVKGEIFAISNTCLHAGGPLGEGKLSSDVVMCPWHGWTYDLKTGASTTMPGAKVPVYRVVIDGKDIKIEG